MLMEEKDIEMDSKLEELNKVVGEINTLYNSKTDEEWEEIINKRMTLALSGNIDVTAIEMEAMVLALRYTSLNKIRR